MFEADDQEQIKPVKLHLNCQPGDMADQLKALWTNGVRGHIVLICPDCEVFLRYNLSDEGLVERGVLIEEVDYESDSNSTQSVQHSSTPNDRITRRNQKATAKPTKEQAEINC